MKFFTVSLTPFFKNILGFFFTTATNTHIALSWSFPMLPRPFYLLPRPFQQQPIWIIKIPRRPHKNTKKEAKWYHHIRKKNMFNKTSSKSTKCFFMFSLKKKAASLMLLLLVSYYSIYQYAGNGIFFFYLLLPVYINLLLALYFCLFFHMYNSKKLIRHYVSFRIVIHLSDIITYSQNYYYKS